MAMVYMVAVGTLARADQISDAYTSLEFRNPADNNIVSGGDQVGLCTVCCWEHKYGGNSKSGIFNVPSACTLCVLQILQQGCCPSCAVIPGAAPLGTHHSRSPATLFCFNQVKHVPQCVLYSEIDNVTSINKGWDVGSGVGWNLNYPYTGNGTTTHPNRSVWYFVRKISLNSHASQRQRKESLPSGS
jgi:hypothetical protein